MADTASKPGTACLCCRRRKLKCSRDASGCDNCQKASLPCIYPAADTGAKRKRGPYKKKDKPAREAHLDHVVKYLSNPVSSSACASLRPRDCSPSPSTSTPKDPVDLVKDALIALTKTSVSDTPQVEPLQPVEALSTHHLMLLWNIFTIRVDPVTKLFSCTDIAPHFFEYIGGRHWKLGDSICFAAISSLTAEECQTILGSSKLTLQKYYRSRIQRETIQNHDAPDLQSMQAMVLYLVCVCREELEPETWALFSLIVRNAQLMDLHKDPVTAPPVEAELRRRLWWTICSLESRCAEEGSEKVGSLLSSVSVRLPLNFNDHDLTSGASEIPKPRTGITEMSFVLVRWHIMRLSAYVITKLKHQRAQPRSSEKVVRSQLRHELDHVAKLLHDEILIHCHESRPFDWLIMVIAEIMLVKVRLLIDFPNRSAPESLSPTQRYDQLELSVNIIRRTYGILSDPRSHIYQWFFRSYMQWHSLAIVITEIGKGKDPAFIRSAWSAIEPFIKMWTRIYLRKKHDPTWRHVNTLIEKAQEVAEAKLAEHGPTDKPCCNVSKNYSEGILPFNIVPDRTQPASIDEWPRMPEEAFATPFSMDPDTLALPNDLSDIAMLDPMLNVPSLGAFESDLNALNTVFADANWSYGVEDMYDVQQTES